jgi:hypothetical protein
MFELTVGCRYEKLRQLKAWFPYHHELCGTDGQKTIVITRLTLSVLERSRAARKLEPLQAIPQQNNSHKLGFNTLGH